MGAGGYHRPTQPGHRRHFALGVRFFVLASFTTYVSHRGGSSRRLFKPLPKQGGAEEGGSGDWHSFLRGSDIDLLLCLPPLAVETIIAFVIFDGYVGTLAESILQ